MEELKISLQVDLIVLRLLKDVNKTIRLAIPVTEEHEMVLKFRFLPLFSS